MHFNVLGPIEVVADGAALELGGAKPRLVLLSLLMAENGVVSTDRLVEQVWGSRPPAKPHVTLRSYISNLRRALEPERSAGQSRLLITRSPGYQLVVDDDDVDARRFTSLIRAAHASLADGQPSVALDRAMTGLGLWRAEDLPELDPFPIEVARLQQLRAEARFVRYRALLELGRHAEAVPLLIADVRTHPADESLCRTLMLALYRSGRAADALRAAAELRSHLGEELGLDVSPPTIDLERQILTNDPSLAMPRAAQRATDPTADSHPHKALNQPSSAAPDDAAPPGRQREFSAITASLGDGAVAVLTGEPGIGKTTLMSAAADRAVAAGRWVVWGRCHDGGQARSLWPWVSVIGALVDRLDDEQLSAAAGSRASDLAGVVPEIGDRLGVEARSASDAFAIADAVVRLVERAATIRPCTLIFDDLQWVDPTSAQLLAMALPAWGTSPITVLCSWRDTEPAHPEAADAVAAIGRAAGRHRIELDGLDVQTIATLAETELGERPDDAMIDALAERTSGNPLFATELLRQADPIAASATTTIREAILQRVEQLPTGAVDRLATAALCRQGFNERMLHSEPADASDETTLQLLDEAMARRLIEEDPERPNRFRFTHSLIGEALADTLTPPRRAQRHAQLGFALEQIGAPTPELAHHFLEGAHAGTALLGAEYACAAARANRFLHDHLSAITLIERGLDALDHAEGEERAIAEIRIDLLLDLAQGRKHQQRQTDVHDLTTRAFELSREIGDSSRMAIAALAYTGNAPQAFQPVVTQWLGYWNPPGPALEMLSASLSKMTETDPLRPSVLIAHASEMFGPSHDPDIARTFIDEGIAAARRLGEPTQLTSGLLKKISALNRDLTLDERQETLTEALTIAVEQGFTSWRFAALRWLAIAALDRHDRQRADEIIREATEVANASEDRHLKMEVESIDIAMAMFDGDYAKADESLQAAFAAHGSTSPGAMTRFAIQFGRVMEDQGHFDRIIDGFRSLFDQYPGPGYGVPFALMLARSGRPDEAIAIIDTLSEHDIVNGGESELQFTTLASMTELIWWLDDDRLADQLCASLEPGTGRIVTLFDGITLHASVSTPLGIAHAMAGRLDEAESLLQASLEHHRALGARPAGIQSLVGLADVAHRMGAAEKSRALIAEARTEAHAIGAIGWLVDEVERRVDEAARG